MTLRARVALAKRVPRGRGRVLRPRLDDATGDDARARPRRVRRRRAARPQPARPHAGAARRRAAARGRAGVHGPGRGRLRRRRRSRAGDEVVLFGPATRRADRPGLGRRARHHPLRGGHRACTAPGSPAPTSGAARVKAARLGRARGRARGGGHRRRRRRGGPAARQDRRRPAQARHRSSPTTSEAPLGEPSLGRRRRRRAPVVRGDRGRPGKPALTVVLVHGFALDRRTWHFQRPFLAALTDPRVRVVLYDQRSHGRSERAPRESCTIEQLGHDLDAVIRALAPEGPLVLVGHSMGGMTIMALAELLPRAGQRAGGGRGVPRDVGGRGRQLRAVRHVAVAAQPAHPRRSACSPRCSRRWWRGCARRRATSSGRSPAGSPTATAASRPRWSTSSTP